MSRKPWIVAVCVLAAISMPGTTLAASGGRDASFNGDGAIIFDPYGPNDGFTNVKAVVSHNGKVFLAGAGGRVNSGTSDVFIARLGPNGFLDKTCNGRGSRVLDLGGHDDADKGFAVLPSGKMLLAGNSSSSPSGPTTDLFLARFLPDCKLDPTFAGGHGVFKDDFGYPFGAFALDLAVLPSYKIIVVGEVRPAQEEGQVAVWRFNWNGTPDLSFGGGDGLVTLDVAPGQDRALRVVVLNDGKILVGGWAASDTSPFLDVMLARFNPNGSIDTTFGVGGSVTYNPRADLYDYVSGMAFSNGKIILCVDGDRFDSDVVLMKLLSNGMRDPSWGGGDGQRAIDFGGNEWCTDVVVDAGGRIVIGGGRGNGWLVARFLASGDPDLGFGNGGFNTAAIKGGALGIALDGAGRILLGGYNIGGDAAATRFLP